MPPLPPPPSPPAGAGAGAGAGRRLGAVPPAEWPTVEIALTAASVVEPDAACTPAAACAACADSLAVPLACGCGHLANAVCGPQQRWDVFSLPQRLQLDLGGVVSVRRVQFVAPTVLATHQRVSHYRLQCASSATGPWENATSGPSGTLSTPPDNPLNVTTEAVCDARHWRLELLATFGTASDTPRTAITSVRFFGVPTPSPPPPPLPSPPPPPPPRLPIYVPDLEAMERERVRCVARELRGLSLAAVASSGVLGELPVDPGCAWSAGDALEAENTLRTLEPLTRSLASSGAQATPLYELSQVALQLLPTRTFGPLFDHWFALTATRAARGEPLSRAESGVWATWRRGLCVIGEGGDSADPRSGMRKYLSELERLPERLPKGVGKIDACFHLSNRPLLLGRIRAVQACRLLRTGAILGEVHVPDGGCGVCTPPRDCGRRNEAGRSTLAAGLMAIDVDEAGLHQHALRSVGSEGGDLGAMTGTLRAQIRLGWPLRGYENCVGSECVEQQEALLLAWTQSVLVPKLEALEKATRKADGGVKVRHHFEPHVEAVQTAEVVGSDMALAALPLPVGFVYLLLYTNSVFLSAVAALMTVVAWPAALFLYRSVLGLHHFEELTLLASPMTAPFILEAVTLLIDSWRKSTMQPAHVIRSLSSRLSWVMRDGGLACVDSILVGMAGFIACSTSTWLPIAHIGTFCTLLLLTQLALALSVLPICLVLFHDWIEAKPNLCFECCQPAPAGASRGWRLAHAWSSALELLKPQAQTTTEHWRDAREIEATIGTKPNGAVLRSRTWPLPRWLAWLVLPQLRIATRRRTLLAGFLGLLVPVAYSVMGASVATTPRGRLVDSHPLLAMQRDMHGGFGISSTEDTVRATLLWGVRRVLTSGVEPPGSDEAGRPFEVNLVRNSTFVGRLEFREPFALDEAAQRHFARACAELRRQPWVQLDAEAAASGLGGRVECFVDGFRDWLSNRSASAVPDFGREYPVPMAKQPALALATYLASDAGELWQPYVGSVGLKNYVRFVAIGVKLRLRSSATRSEAAASAQQVLNFTAQLDAEAPESVGPALASTEEVWAWMRAQGALPGEAMGGAARTAIACLVALLLISGSVPLTVLAAAAVACATSTILALLVASGWALGSVEAVLACVTPSLLTPPAALVVRSYVRASRTTGASEAVEGRAERAMRAFEQAAAPITSSWVAMSVALAPMLLCQLATEFKVAAALCFLGLCISAWVGVFFPALLAELGPQAAAPGLPLWGSLPWLLLPRLPKAERVAVDDEVPCTLAWYYARKRKRRQEASAALQEEIVRAMSATEQAAPLQTASSMRMVRRQSTSEQYASAAMREASRVRPAKPRPAGGRRGSCAMLEA